MPEIFRAYGFSFMFFSRDHEPIHIHVIGNNGHAKYKFDGNDFYLEYSQNIKANDLKKIKSMIDENRDIIIRNWNDFFMKEK